MDALLEKINKLYGLSVHSPEKVTKGLLTENHVLTEGDKKYFLKRYRFDSKKEIEEIHLVKKYFASGGIPVILPILNKELNTFFAFENKYFALFPFVEGRQLELDSLTDTAIISLGEMLGKIHLLGKEAKLSITDDFGAWDKEKVLAKFENITAMIYQQKELSDFDKLALEDLKRRKFLVESNSINFEDLGLKNDHLIQGDYHTGNLFFDDYDHVSSVFDFEKARYAPRVFELVRSLAHIFFQNDFSPGNITKAKLYLNSYLKIYPISRGEIEKGFKIYYLKMLHSSWVQSEHYLKNNYRVDHLLAGNFERIKYLSEHLEELINKLMIL
ncbi:MAG: phosphotransferase [Candidatus Paceibacterota bacterium]|jgi:homoserine kinase type II